MSFTILPPTPKLYINATDDDMVRVIWHDDQGRRCTTFLTATQIGKMALKESNEKSESPMLNIPLDEGI